MGAIDAVIAAQAALIAALDAGDVGGIEHATAALSRALVAARQTDVDPAERAHVDYALKQTHAARTRVGFLADRNARKLERLTAQRGGGAAPTYTALGRLGTQHA